MEKYHLNTIRIVSMIIILIFFNLWQVAPVLSEDSGHNLALGKKYQLDPPPNYSYCADAGDITQLTDGQYNNGNWYFWAQKGAVGWITAPVEITIDLGKIEPIAGLSYNTAAGAADVLLPGAIFVLVSEDSSIWHYVGDLVVLSKQNVSPPALDYAVYRYKSMDIATHGRFVKLLIIPSGWYTSVDEIEVYQGQDKLLTEPFVGPGLTSMSVFLTEMCLQRRLKNDLAAVTQELNLGGFPEYISEPLKAEINAIAQDISSTVINSLDTFTTVFPINNLHRSLFAVQAGIWRAKGLCGVVCWQSNRWDMLNPIAAPAQNNAAIDMYMMSNEFRSEAFNISNAGDTEAKVTLTLEGLPGGINPAYIEVREVLFTDTYSGTPVATALPLVQRQNGVYVLKIPAGFTRQVWLNFHPTDVDAGEYNGQIFLGSGGANFQQIPVRLKIYPFRFPDQPTLHVSGFDYADPGGWNGVTPENRTAFIQHLREHFVDSPWATSTVLPLGEFDQNGRMIQPPSPAAFRAWLNSWPNARNYLVFTIAEENFAGFPMGTPAFQQAVSDWINWWVNQLKQWDIKPNQLGLLLVDEPNTLEKDQVVIEYAKVIRAIQPEVVIWENPIWLDPSQGTPELFALSKVLCLPLPIWLRSNQAFADFYIAQREAGRQLWFYSTEGPSRLLDPYSYYRLQEWFAWKYKAEGSSFWSFSDNPGASSWNEYIIRNVSDGVSYTPLFLDSTSVTSGKQMEAIHEGVEDYEYLRMLRDYVEQLEKQGKLNQVVKSARVLLDTAVNRVTDPIANFSLSKSWNTLKDRSIADQVRVEILDTLTQLDSLQQALQPGDNLTYAVNFKNPDEVNVCEEYITDTFDTVARTISRFTDRLPLKRKGSVIFRANVNTGAATDKTQIINSDIACFSSALETIRTNNMVNMASTAIDAAASITVISALPLSNQAGWSNTDVNISLTAADNEGGTGVKEIHYKLEGAVSDEKIVAETSAQVTIFTEGVTTLTYYAVDNAGNVETLKSLRIKLDKTPPLIMVNAMPKANVNGWNNSDVTVNFTAMDNLSGVLSATMPTVVTSEGKEQYIGGEAIDLAGNYASAFVILNIDKALPKAAPQLKYIKYQLFYSAFDILSGLSSYAGDKAQETDTFAYQ